MPHYPQAWALHSCWFSHCFTNYFLCRLSSYWIDHCSNNKYLSFFDLLIFFHLHFVTGRAYKISVETVSQDQISVPTTAQYRTIPLSPRNITFDTKTLTAHSFTVRWEAPKGRGWVLRQAEVESGAWGLVGWKICSWVLCMQINSTY